MTIILFTKDLMYEFQHKLSIVALEDFRLPSDIIERSDRIVYIDDTGLSTILKGKV